MNLHQRMSLEIGGIHLYSIPTMKVPGGGAPMSFALVFSHPQPIDLRTVADRGAEWLLAENATPRRDGYA